MSISNQDTSSPEPMFYIYGKHETQKRFRPMDLSKGVRVVNLIFATRVSGALKEKFFSHDAKANPDWEFKARRIRISRRLRS